MLEQQGLIGDQQGIAVQQVDLELAHAHLVHKRVARQPERRHAAIHLVEKRPKAIVGTDTESAGTLLAASIETLGRQERLVRVAVTGEHVELKLSGNHWRQPEGCVAGDNLFELAAGRQRRGLAVEFVGIADHQSPWLIAPGHPMQLREVRNQGQVAVVGAIEPGVRIATHDALQQHPAGQLQAPTFKESFGGHDLAAGHTVEVGGDAFDLINAR